MKENDKNGSSCNQHENYFNYHGIENALCGKDEFTPKRILVIQMNKKKENLNSNCFIKLSTNSVWARGVQTSPR